MRHLDFKIQTAFMLFFLCCAAPALLAFLGLVSPEAYGFLLLIALALLPFGALQVFSCLFKIGQTTNNWRILHLGFTALFFTLWVSYLHFNPKETALIVAGIYALYAMPIILGIGYYWLVFSEYRAAKAEEEW